MTRIASTDRDMLAQSRALGDPTRHAIFVELRDAPDPMSVAELTDEFGLNHNAIRQHLAKLRDAGLVTEHRDPPRGPGRPPVRWKLVPGAGELWGGSNPYETLSMLLVEVIHGGASPREVGHEAGRRLADDERGGDTVEILDAVARRLGFEPHLRPTRTGTDVVLERCPFVDAATAAPEIVCELHRGIAEGIAESADDDATITDVVVRTPRRAGCRITVAVAD